MRAGKRASQGADDSGGHGVVEAERIADGDGNLAHGDFLRIGKTEMVQIGQVDAQDRQVGVGIIADDVGARFAAIRRLRPHLVGPVDDVAVGHHESVGRNEKARAASAPAFLFGAGLDMNDRGTGLSGRSRRPPGNRRREDFHPTRKSPAGLLRRSPAC